MGETRKILDMIEEVDRDDTDTLDEIDARTACYSLGIEYLSHARSYDFESDQMALTARTPMSIVNVTHALYTRSRDALKKIRPDWWRLNTNVWPEGITCVLVKMGNCPDMVSPHYGSLPTEELAELHAIIQAIEWERQNSAE